MAGEDVTAEIHGFSEPDSSRRRGRRDVTSYVRRTPSGYLPSVPTADRTSRR